MHHEFGRMLLAQTHRGVCAISFLAHDTHAEEIAELQKQWPHAEIVEDATCTAAVAGRIFNRSSVQDERIHLTVRGTNFQINVWKALLRIPPGQIRSYQQLAAQLGKPGAYRAVATAIAANPAGFLIPCHRVLRSSGDAGEYHWGRNRKQAMLAWEAAKNEVCKENRRKTAGNSDRITQQTGG